MLEVGSASRIGDILSTVGMFSTVGDIIIHVFEDFLSTVRDTMMHVGDIMSTVGMFLTMGDIIFFISVPWGDIMIHVGDIMSSMRDVSYSEKKSPDILCRGYV